MKVIIGCIIVIIASLISIFIWTSQKRAIPCPFWLRWFVEIENPFTKNNRSSTIVEQLNIQAGMTVMDIGCGPGRVTIPLAEAVGSHGKVIAVDIQSKMLERAKKKASAKNLQNIEFIRMSIDEANFKPNEADRIALVNVLGEIPNKQSALHEIYQALKPGGILCVTEVILDPQFQKRETVLKLASKAGFREKQFFGSKFAFSLCLEKPV
ncbi:class I SAM-dependent methyltransferase [Pueribacillus sp. YX66]|uniref:class I SAM-dependent methyltransferase n=1 Tax=Pueribacillus sp. YX66 TaxID=3229242 RepID=UPI00358D4892